MPLVVFPEHAACRYGPPGEAAGFRFGPRGTPLLTAEGSRLPFLLTSASDPSRQGRLRHRGQGRHPSANFVPCPWREAGCQGGGGGRHLHPASLPGPHLRGCRGTRPHLFQGHRPPTSAFASTTAGTPPSWGRTSARATSEPRPATPSTFPCWTWPSEASTPASCPAATTRVSPRTLGSGSTRTGKAPSSAGISSCAPSPWRECASGWGPSTGRATAAR